MQKSDLGKKILKYRGKHDLTQVEFAEKCGVTVQTICNIENGIQNPSKLTKQKILIIIEEEES